MPKYYLRNVYQSACDTNQSLNIICIFITNFILYFTERMFINNTYAYT